MKIKLFSLCTLSALLFATASCSSSVTTSNGTGTYSNMTGEFKSSIEAGFDETWTASLQAVKELEFDVEEENKDSLNARIVARRYNDKKVSIGLEKSTDAMTMVEIKVGTFGDKDLSVHIFDTIKSEL